MLTRDLESAVFTAEVNVVPLYVNVTDGRGVYIPDMRVQEFEVYENGEKQEILFFDSEPRPVVIGILIDTSGSMEGIKMARAKQGATAFVEHITDQDEAFVMGFDAFPRLLQNLTPNHARLRDGAGASIHECTAVTLAAAKRAPTRRRAARPPRGARRPPRPARAARTPCTHGRRPRRPRAARAAAPPRRRRASPCLYEESAARALQLRRPARRLDHRPLERCPLPLSLIHI